MAELTELGKAAASTLASGKATVTRASKPSFTFPSVLNSGKYPYMVITESGGTGKENIFSMALYTPPGISFSDGASYGTMNLGVLGNAIVGQDADALRSKFENISAGDVAKGVGAAVDKSLDVARNNAAVVAMSAAAATTIGTKLGALGAVAAGASAKELISYNEKTILNPFQVTNFTGNQIRSYTFAFKLKPESKKEADDINEMLHAMRARIYAQTRDGENMLRYPTTFDIMFLLPEDDDNKNSKENPYIPKIMPVYCTNMQVTYNSESSTFYSDGAPSEVDVTLSFQETRALTAHDIENLHYR